MNFNKSLIGGNLVRDPELRFLPSNTAVASFTVAVNRKWKNQQGEQQEEVSFVDCTAFGRTAEVINQHFRKGRPIFVEGRLRQEKWQDKDGNNRSKIGIVVESFQFVGGHDESQGQQQGGYQQQSRGGYRPQAGTQQPYQPQDQHEPVDDSDIPF